jgi:hypothetical protein
MIANFSHPLKSDLKPTSGSFVARGFLDVMLFKGQVKNGEEKKSALPAILQRRDKLRQAIKNSRGTTLT